MPMVLVPQPVPSVTMVRWTMLKVLHAEIVPPGDFNTNRSVKPVRLAHSKAKVAKVRVRRIHPVLRELSKTWLRQPQPIACVTIVLKDSTNLRVATLA